MRTDGTERDRCASRLSLSRDEELIAAARDVLCRNYHKDRAISVGAAVRCGIRGEFTSGSTLKPAATVRRGTDSCRRGVQQGGTADQGNRCGQEAWQALFGAIAFGNCRHSL